MNGVIDMQDAMVVIERLKGENAALKAEMTALRNSEKRASHTIIVPWSLDIEKMLDGMVGVFGDIRWRHVVQVNVEMQGEIGEAIKEVIKAAADWEAAAQEAMESAE